MSDPIFGISITRVDDETRSAVAADMAVVGLVGTAPSANAETFPLNTPVLVFSDDTAAATGLGTDGTLPGQITLINEQLGDLQVAARIVVVRVEEGDTDDDTIANLIGDPALKTGMYALRLAGPILGVVPRLLGVPGFTYQQDSGLGTLTLGTQGSALTAAPAVGFTGGGNDPDKVLPTAHAVLGTGGDADKVVALVIDDTGSHLSGLLTVTFTGGGADENKVLPTATATVETLANPVCAALPSICSALLAHAVVTGPHNTATGFTDWRETLDSERLIPVETWVKVGADAATLDSVGSILGALVRVDHANNGRPFHSAANQPIYGIVGPNRYIEFSLTDGATEAQSILANNGGVILRGEAGVETAIASGGFQFVGTDNAGTDELWRFYNVTRGRDYIHLRFLTIVRQYLGTANLTGHTIQAIINSMSSELRDLQADGDILGFQCGFERDQNNPTDLRAGKFKVTFQAEEAPVLRYVGIRSERYLPALDALLDDLQTQLGVAV